MSRASHPGSNEVNIPTTLTFEELAALSMALNDFQKWDSWSLTTARDKIDAAFAFAMAHR